jgi:ATP-dependent Clp protease ATP-binding subunit ClpA
LNQAFTLARESRHEFLTVEHLLYTISDTPKVREVLSACGGDPDRLRADLLERIGRNTPQLAEGDDREVQPDARLPACATGRVPRVPSRVVVKIAVTNVLLVAVFGEKQSHAVFFLRGRTSRGSTSSTTSRTACRRARK